MRSPSSNTGKSWAKTFRWEPFCLLKLISRWNTNTVMSFLSLKITLCDYLLNARDEYWRIIREVLEYLNQIHGIQFQKALMIYKQYKKIYILNWLTRRGKHVFLCVAFNANANVWAPQTCQNEFIYMEKNRNNMTFSRHSCSTDSAFHWILYTLFYSA